MKEEQYIFSIDPGIRYAAYTVFNHSGVIKQSETIKFNTKLSQSVRLQILYSTLVKAAEKYPPSNVLTEYQFVDIMSSIVGVVMAFSGLHPDVEFTKMTPSNWKKLATGKGNVDEEELKKFILSRYPESKDYDEHQIDTLGIYIAYLEKKKELANGISKDVKRTNKRKKSSKD